MWIIISICSFHKKRRQPLRSILSSVSMLWVCVSVYLGSIFSHNMPAARTAYLILLKPCHETVQPPPPRFIIVRISVAQKYRPCWPFPYFQTVCVILFLTALRVADYGNHFAVLGCGKEDGGGVSAIMGAGIRKWPTEINSDTQTVTQ